MSKPTERDRMLDDLRRLAMTVLRLARKDEPETSYAKDVMRRYGILQGRIVPTGPGLTPRGPTTHDTN